MSYKKTVFGICVFFCLFFLNSAEGQVQIIIPGMPSGMVKPEMLWNLVVVNQENQSFVGRIQLTIVDKNNTALLNVFSNQIVFSKGTKSITYTNAIPLDYVYNNIGSNQSWLKVGQYTICYTVVNDQGKEAQTVGSECEELNIEPMAPPLLNEPPDTSSIYDVRPNFLWTPPAPVNIFSDLKYELRIAEFKEGQTLSDAIEYNVPEYFENGFTINAKSYPSSYGALKVGHTYVWQITAYDPHYSIKSDIWKFKVVEDTVMNIIEGSPYLRLSSSVTALGTMHQGYLKLLLSNYTTDSIAVLKIKEEGSSDESYVTTVAVKIKPGENFVIQQLDKAVRLNEKKVYQVIWINGRNEKWSIRYQPKYYR